MMRLVPSKITELSTLGAAFWKAGVRPFAGTQSVDTLILVSQTPMQCETSILPLWYIAFSYSSPSKLTLSFMR